MFSLFFFFFFTLAVEVAGLVGGKVICVCSQQEISGKQSLSFFGPKADLNINPQEVRHYRATLISSKYNMYHLRGS